MSIEGQLRDLALSEVLQLLAASRKTGVLSLTSALRGREASIALEYGAMTSVSERGTFTGTSHFADDMPLLERVLRLMRWREGDFRFAPAATVTQSGERVSVDAALMEAARRADAWETLGDLIADSDVIPVFPAQQPQAVSLLHLTPDHWEVLTRVDGERTIEMLARSLDRDVVDVAHTIHALIAEGVLAVIEPAPQRADASIPTPLSTASVTIPPVYVPTLPFGMEGEDDSLFDPMQVGVMTPDGMPAMSGVSTPAGAVTPAVAHARHEPSPHTESKQSVPAADLTLLNAGDEAARAGNLSAAIERWSAWLATSEDSPHIAQVKERITHARRLLQLLQFPS